MQQMQKMATNGIVIGLDINHAAVVAVVVPVQQHRTKTGHQLIGDITRTRMIVVIFLRRHAAEYRHARAHHVHRMRRWRQFFQRRLHRCRDPAQCF